MNSTYRVAVCSRSFSKNPILRAELLRRYKKVTFNDQGLQLNGDDLISFLKGHELAITALEKLDGTVLSQLPELMAVGKYGVGLDMIDLNSMRTYGKKLGWTKGVNRRSVAELTLCFAISMLRHVPLANDEVKKGIWRQQIGSQLSEKSVGIIGCGCVGQDLVRLLQPFNCQIQVNDLLHYDDFYRAYDVKAVNLEELLSGSDIISLHVPLNKSTHGMISSSHFALMKKNAILINTARGGLVDEIALKKALLNNQIAGAAFDVFNSEPPEDLELISLSNFLSTSHIGGSAQEAILAMGMAAIDGLENAIEIPEDLSSYG